MRLKRIKFNSESKRTFNITGNPLFMGVPFFVEACHIHYYCQSDKIEYVFEG